LISRFHIFAPVSVGMTERARLAPRLQRELARGFTPSIVRLNVLRCGSIAGHADLAGSPVGYGLPIPTVGGSVGFEE
jgi:hypothetical protein